MIQLTSTGGILQTPTAAITVNRNRMKAYGNTVYMKSGANYEIELFNPLTTRVLAVIEIDGKKISNNGLVIKPGQRVYLERWIDDAKKFKFSTYEVENSPEARNAIASNGKVRVSFYEETQKLGWSNGVTVVPGSAQPYYYSYDNLTLTPHNLFSSSSTSYFANGTANVFTNVNNIGIRGADGPSGLQGAKGIETGMSEKGEASNQSFESTSGDFNSWATSDIILQILPESQKPQEVEKIRSYCTECGTRVRSTSWKFCPSCGEKL